jgi:hypothetical protein
VVIDGSEAYLFLLLTYLWRTFVIFLPGGKYTAVVVQIHKHYRAKTHYNQTDP